MSISKKYGHYDGLGNRGQIGMPEYQLYPVYDARRHDRYTGHVGSTALDTGGLTVGAQFFAPFGDETTLFHMAAQLEEAQPWFDTRPPLKT